MLLERGSALGARLFVKLLLESSFTSIAPLDLGFRVASEAVVILFWYLGTSGLLSLDFLDATSSFSVPAAGPSKSTEVDVGRPWAGGEFESLFERAFLFHFSLHNLSVFSTLVI